MQIRNAKQEDASFLSKTILLAGRAHVQRGIWEVILGGTEEECLTFLHHISITDIPHLFHYSCYLIAEEEGLGPIGSLGGYDPIVLGYPALQKAILEVVSKEYHNSPTAKGSEARAAKLLACIPKEIDGAWVIDSVATLPDYRGKGVAENLLRKILETGKNQGFSRAQINMYIGNSPALNLYQKIGFKIVEKNCNDYFREQIGSPGMLSLVKEL